VLGGQRSEVRKGKEKKVEAFFVFTTMPMGREKEGHHLGKRKRIGGKKKKEKMQGVVTKREGGQVVHFSFAGSFQNKKEKGSLIWGGGIRGGGEKEGKKARRRIR